MKNIIWMLLTGSITFFLMFFLEMDILLFIILLVPLLIIFFTYGSFLYSFRASLKAELIPQNGYEDRIEKLGKEKFELNQLGFNKIAELYLKTIPDSITYVFKHEKENVFSCIYHFGPKIGYDFLSHFERGATLTTASVVEGGMAPRPEKDLLQIFERTSYKRGFEKHLLAQKLIQSNGIRLIEINNDDYIPFILKSIKDLANYVRKIPFWPVMLIWWTISKRGKRYLKTIEEQIKDGQIKNLR